MHDQTCLIVQHANLGSTQFSAENPPSQFVGKMRAGGVKGARGRRPEVSEERRQGEPAEWAASKLLRKIETCPSLRSQRLPALA